MFLRSSGLQAVTSSVVPNGSGNTYQVPYLITSGSGVQTGSWADVSQWNNVWLQSNVSGGMAGTASFYVTSVSDLDVNPPLGSDQTPNSASAVKILEVAMPDATWVTSSATFTAKWGQFVFTPTSASSGITGSLVMKASFSNIG